MFAIHVCVCTCGRRGACLVSSSLTLHFALWDRNSDWTCSGQANWSASSQDLPVSILHILCEAREHWVSSSFSNLFLEMECLSQQMWCSHTWLDGAQRACDITHAGVDMYAVPSVNVSTGKPNSDLMPAHQALSHLTSTATRLFIVCLENRVLLCKLGWLGIM